MLERRIEQEIRDFLKSDRKEALMVTGARQVGKTYIIRECAKEIYKNIVEINFVENQQAVKLFDLIHSVDSLHLAEALNNAAAGIDKVQNVLVQVNLAKEDSKSGIYEEELEELLHKVDEMENLHLQGLMLIAPNYEDVEECRPLFKKMYQIFQQAKAWSLNNSEMKYLSMGMTHDYQIAIEEGANIVRVGTAIFGQRQY